MTDQHDVLDIDCSIEGRSRFAGDYITFSGQAVYRHRQSMTAVECDNFRDNHCLQL